jgi:hypothetical protein
MTEQHPLDLCTKKSPFSFLLTNNNSYCTSNSNKTSSSKSIWSPASSCEEENEQRSLRLDSPTSDGLYCQTCQRQFTSPTKLEVHCRKVHHLGGGGGGTKIPSPSSGGRKERIFKVRKIIMRWQHFGHHHSSSRASYVMIYLFYLVVARELYFMRAKPEHLTQKLTA